MTEIEHPKSSVVRFLPLAVFAAMALLFALLLTDDDRNPKQIKSALIGKTVPDISLPPLADNNPPLTSDDLKIGKPVILNFFASWCVPCRAEHESLMELAANEGVTVYGIAHKDKPEASRKFLAELGNPYAKIGVDRDGFKASIDFGISGVPETFIIDGNGKILYRHWGPIVDGHLENIILPKLREAK